MDEPPPRRGPLSTIAGWMITIAAIGVIMGITIVAPFASILPIFLLMETLAILRFRESRRKPMSGNAVTLWALAFIFGIPIVSVVAWFAALYAYCTANPDAFRNAIG